MKGKSLNNEEILKLDGQYVYIEPQYNNFDDEGKAEVMIVSGTIFFYPNNGSNPWDCPISDERRAIYLKVYEWIDYDDETVSQHAIDNILKRIESASKEQKPPLGLTPKYQWNEQRLQDIKNAINRYVDAKLAISKEWIDEYEELRKIINS